MGLREFREETRIKTGQKIIFVSVVQKFQNFENFY